MKPMQVSNVGIELIKTFEGCMLNSYQCPAGVWTIGYGSTRYITEGMTITQIKAEQLLKEDLRRFEDDVNQSVTVPLSQQQFDALVSWTYNLGCENLRRSTMLKQLNQSNYDSVPKEMSKWNKAKGVVLNGLVRRRHAEGLLFQGKEWYSA